MSILVLGANGFLGLHVVRALRDAGFGVRAGRRARSNVLALRPLGVPMVEADLDRPETLRAAMDGVRTVVHAAGHYPRLSTDRAATLTRGAAQMTLALDAAAEAGVERFVHLSSTATVARVAGRPSTERDRFPRIPGFGVYHDLKWTMEAIAEAEDRLEVITACPGACLGAWDLRIGTSALLVALARGLKPRFPDGLVNLVDACDVADAVRELVDRPCPPARVLLSGSTWRLHALLTRLAPRYGVPPPGPPISPSEAFRLADREEARCAREGGRPALSREIADLVVHGCAIDASTSRRALGLSYRPLHTTLDHFDEWARRMRFLPPRVAEHA